MKQYMNQHQLYLVGKGYQVKAALNGIAKSKYAHMTLAQYTATRPEMHITLGTISIVNLDVNL